MELAGEQLGQGEVESLLEDQSEQIFYRQGLQTINIKIIV